MAAANAVSDVYAMGGRPLLALNLVGWNSEELSSDLLAEVLLGAQDVATEAGFVIAGGHTVDDPEPKFGLAVVGEVHPDRVLTNAGFRPDDFLVLSKPLGVGVTTTAIKRGDAPSELVTEVLDSMVRLNDDAARIAVGAGATGATDVTGFGLLGHLGRALVESGLDARLEVAAVAVPNGVRALVESGAIPGGRRRNLAWADERLDRGSIDELDVLVLADAQTSGGLLFGVAEDKVDDVVVALKASDHRPSVVGQAAVGEGLITLV